MVLILSLGLWMDIWNAYTFELLWMFIYKTFSFYYSLCIYYLFMDSLSMCLLEVRGPPARIISLLLPCGSQRLNLGPQA